MVPHFSHKGNSVTEPVRFTYKRRISPSFIGFSDRLLAARPSRTKDEQLNNASLRSKNLAGNFSDSSSLSTKGRGLSNLISDKSDNAKENSSSIEEEFRADLVRLQAEYVNYRKRVERDREGVRDLAVQSVLLSLLPVLDDIDTIRQHGDLGSGSFSSVAKRLDIILASYGLKRITDTGNLFNPSIHEALMQQSHNDIPVDHIVSVLRPGYYKGDRVIRAAQVIVSIGPTLDDSV